jgi:hypothetical protein
MSFLSLDHGSLSNAAVEVAAAFAAERPSLTLAELARSKPSPILTLHASTG